MESANDTPPQGSSEVDSSEVDSSEVDASEVDASSPSPGIFSMPAHSTSSSLAGSRTARQLPPSPSSRTHGLKTIGKTIPLRSAPASPANASIDPEKTYSS